MTTALAPLGRDLKVMGLVGTAHAASHFFHLVLPPLFPLLRTEFDLSYAALGLLTTLFYGASGIAQTIAGFLVDRFGARRILLGGLILLSVSVTGYGLATEFWMLLVLSVLAGLGNSVFHPADLSILTSKVSPSRLGRAYGAHALCGYLGWAIAPGFVVAVASLADWRVAVIAAGLTGLAVVVLLVVWGGEDLAEAPAAVPVRRGTAGILRDVRLLLSPTILSCFAYFTFLSAALVGVQTFGLTAMQAIYSVTLHHATIALTAFLVGGAAGIFVGGFAADRTERHDVIAMSGVMLSAVVLVAIGAEMTGGGLLVPAIAMAGFLSGTTSPSRDMLVRKATPGGATGRVFGFVYSGLDLGSSLMPLLIGWLLDGGDPRIVFHGCAIAMVITMLTVFEVRRRGVIATGRA